MKTKKQAMINSIKNLINYVENNLYVSTGQLDVLKEFEISEDQKFKNNKILEKCNWLKKLNDMKCVDWENSGKHLYQLEFFEDEDLKVIDNS